MEADARYERYRQAMEQFPCAFNLVTTKVTGAKLKTMKHYLLSELDVDDESDSERIIKLNLLTWVHFRLGEQEEALQLNNDIMSKTKWTNVASIGNRCFIQWQTGYTNEAACCLERLENMQLKDSSSTLLTDAKAEQVYYYSRLGTPGSLQRAIDLFSDLPQTPVNYLRTFGIGLVYRRASTANLLHSSGGQLDAAECRSRAAECLFEVAENADTRLSSMAYAQLVILRRNVPKRLRKNIEELFRGLSVEDLCERALEHGTDIPSVLMQCGIALRPIDIDTSIEFLRKAVDIKANSPAYHHLGISYKQKAQQLANTNICHYPVSINGESEHIADQQFERSTTGRSYEAPGPSRHAHDIPTSSSTTDYLVNYNQRGVRDGEDTRHTSGEMNHEYQHLGDQCEHISSESLYLPNIHRKRHRAAETREIITAKRAHHQEWEYTDNDNTEEAHPVLRKRSNINTDEFQDSTTCQGNINNKQSLNIEHRGDMYDRSASNDADEHRGDMYDRSASNDADEHRGDMYDRSASYDADEHRGDMYDRSASYDADEHRGDMYDRSASYDADEHRGDMYDRSASYDADEHRGDMYDRSASYDADERRGDMFDRPASYDADERRGDMFDRPASYDADEHRGDMFDRPASYDADEHRGDMYDRPASYDADEHRGDMFDRPASYDADEHSGDMYDRSARHDADEHSCEQTRDNAITQINKNSPFKDRNSRYSRRNDGNSRGSQWSNRNPRDSRWRSRKPRGSQWMNTNARHTGNSRNNRRNHWGDRNNRIKAHLSIDDENVQQARKCFENAIDISKENYPAIIDLGVLLKETNQIKDALQHFNNITTSYTPSISHIGSVISAYEQAGLCYLQLNHTDDRANNDDIGKRKLTRAISLAANLVHIMPELQDKLMDIWMSLKSCVAPIGDKHIYCSIQPKRNILELAKKYRDTIGVIQELKVIDDRGLDDFIVIKDRLHEYLKSNQPETALAFQNCVAINPGLKNSDWWNTDSGQMQTLRIKVLLLAISERLGANGDNPTFLFQQIFELVFGSCLGLCDPENGQQTEASSGLVGDVLFLYDTDDSPDEDDDYPTVKSARCLKKLTACLFGLEAGENLKGCVTYSNSMIEEQLTRMKEYQAVVIVLGNENRSEDFQAFLKRLNIKPTGPPKHKILIIDAGFEDSHIPKSLNQYDRFKLQDIGGLGDINLCPGTADGTDTISYVDLFTHVFHGQVDSVLKLFCFITGQSVPST